MTRKILTTLLVLTLAGGIYALYFLYNFGAITKLADLQADEALAIEAVAQARSRVKELIALADTDDSFTALIDDHTLTGWRGNPDFWSVSDGQILGDSRGDLDFNTFLISENEYSDFILKLDFRMDSASGNSGIQYRSTLIDPDTFGVAGYQADIEFGTFACSLNEEHGRWIIAWGGEQRWVDTTGGRVVVDKLLSDTELGNLQNPAQWNSYTVIAAGNHLVHRINGRICLDVIDQYSAASKRGNLALQIHSGKHMRVRFRNVRIKEL